MSVPFLTIVILVFAVSTTALEHINTRPIIGVLTQEIGPLLNTHYGSQYHSYIAASYVKFIEGAGGRVVPIWIGKNKDYYEDVLSKINGVLWPGGGTYFNQSNGYADAGYTIYNIARRMNIEGDYFPIFGICLGFELLTYVVGNRIEFRSDCNSTDQPLPLEFTPDYRNSRMFSDTPSDIINILRTKNVTANFHRYCVTQQSLKKTGLSNKFNVMSLNHDLDGFQFISSLEHVAFPFYGVQFHPEKNIYEWVVERNEIPHDRDAVKVGQYFATFFVSEARKNEHTFMNKSEEAARLIFNYSPVYTGIKGSVFEQCYIFAKSDTT